jgi:small subunit ribosomal protein S4
MGRDLRPKGKQERREGTKLFLKGEKSFLPNHPLVKRPYPPGVHGPASTRRRLSGYAVRLREKQKAKRMYRLLERQFHKYYVMASKQQGDTSEILLQLLELRLDNVVYRLGLATSRDQARQLVNHGHITVNGKKVDIPSYQVRIGEEISVKNSYLAKKYWQAVLPKLEKTETPGWLVLEPKQPSGKITTLPKKDELIGPFDVQLIIEFYSR